MMAKKNAEPSGACVAASAMNAASAAEPPTGTRMRKVFYEGWNRILFTPGGRS